MSAQLERVLLVIGLSIIISAVTWRVTRFILLDTLLNPVRKRFEAWLREHEEHSAFARWAAALYTCAFCVSIWVSAGAVSLWCAITWWWIGWLFIPVWLMGSTGCMVLYRYIDPPDPCLPSKVCGQD